MPLLHSVRILTSKVAVVPTARTIVLKRLDLMVMLQINTGLRVDCPLFQSEMEMITAPPGDFRTDEEEHWRMDLGTNIARNHDKMCPFLNEIVHQTHLVH